MNELPYGLKRVAHEGSKTGDARNIWQGHLTFVTDQAMLNEVAFERDLEIVIKSGLIPLFGVDHNLDSVNFRWVITDSDRSQYGNITCVVTVGYRSYVQLMHTEEYYQRLVKIDQGNYLTQTIGLRDE